MRSHRYLKVVVLCIAGSAVAATAALPQVPAGYQIEPYVTGLSTPNAIAFSPGGAFGYEGQLFVGDSWGGGGMICRVPSKDNKIYFTTASDLFHTDGYYVDRIVEWRPDGSGTVFVDDIPYNLNAMAFGPGGEWGTDLYFASTSEKAVKTVTPDGHVTDFLVGSQFSLPTQAAFDTTRNFRGNLFLSDVQNDVIYEIDPAGNISTFATGFAFTSAAHHLEDGGDLVFGPDGAMYVCDAGAASIYRIIPEPAMLGLLAIRGLAMLWRRRKRGRRGAWLLVVMACGLAVSLAGPAGAQELGGYSYVALSGQPHDVIYDPYRDLAYVSNRSRSEIDVVRLSDLAVLAPIPVSSPGYGMSLTADANQLLVAFFGQDQIGVLDLESGQQVSTFDVPQPHPAHHPLRVDRDSEGRMYWQSGSTGGPFGGIYEFDPDTGASTPVFTDLGGVDMNSTHNREKWLLQIGCSKVAIWDAATQTMTDATEIPGFSCSSWATWIAQGALSADCGTIVLGKSIPEITVLDGSFDVKGMLGVGMSWAVFGDWADLAVMVELEYDETPSNRISVLDTADIAVVDTLVMPEQIGLAEFNGGSKPIELMPDGDTLLAVGQTGLFLIDTRDVPEPAALALLAVGAAALLRRRRKHTYT